MDDRFLDRSVRARPEAFATLLGHMVAEIVGRPVRPHAVLVLNLPEFRFYHGAAMAERRFVTFFYFQDAGMGVMSLIPGLRGSASHVARFRFMLGQRGCRRS